MKFLRNATIGYTWSHESSRRVITHELTFYAELEACLQLIKDAEVALAQHNVSIEVKLKKENVDVHF